MVDIKLNGKEYTCPVCYEEITIEQWQRIVNEWDTSKEVYSRDYFKLFAILTNSPFKQLYESSENEVTIWNHIKWFAETEFKFKDKPEPFISIGGKIISVPAEVKSLSIGQNILVSQECRRNNMLVDSKGNVIEYGNYSMPVAIFLQPIVDGGKFNYDKAKILHEKILKQPAYLIRPIGFFLLSNVLKAGNGQANYWLRMKNNLTLNSLKRLLKWPKSNALHRSMT